MPPTFILLLAWVLLALVAPIIALGALGLAVYPSTRFIGIAALLGGAVGALLAAACNAVFCVLFAGGVSHITAIDWIFTCFGGFSLLAIPVGLIRFSRIRRRRRKPL